MGSIWIILLILAAAAGVIAALILRNRKQKERQQYYDAACRIVQEEYLNKVLRNIPWEDTDLEIRKTMICLKEEHKKGAAFVFDPEQIVNVGRNRKKNELCLPDAAVSGCHMRFFMYEGRLYGEDLDSSNGTGIRHGRGTVRWLRGESEALESGDRIYIGNICLKLTVFECNTASL